MLHLEFPPEHVHVAFTNLVGSTDFVSDYSQGEPTESSRFAVMGRELVVMTNDCRVRFYSLARFEGLLLREISAVHRGSITTLAVSANSGYFLTGGEDAMLKVWDYEAQKTLPYFY
jgi:WD40 repeat protein